MTTTSGDPGQEAAATPELLSATEIRQISEARKREKLTGDLRQQDSMTAEQKHRQEMFLTRRLTPDFIHLLMRRIRDAADGGESELMLGQFPSAWCTDGGRKINAPEEGWPDTLQGFAKEFFDFWETELKPRGFGLRTEIVTFPGGMPGDVGAFLSWTAAVPEDEAR